uniref:Uncharacterized protein n=1 Tax=Hucho hucho TaxID=62062 RepID=A0A4W5RZZ3_9TELE
CVLLQVPLVEQHYFTEFWKFLKHKHNVERVSGDSQLKISFIETDQKNSIIICTSQILENYLKRPHSGDDDGIQLSGRTKGSFGTRSEEGLDIAACDFLR